MATNGNNPTTEASASDVAMRQMMAGTAAGKAPLPQQPRTLSLSVHMGDAIAQLREIAHFSNDWANNLQIGLDQYRDGMQQMLGKIGK